MNSDSRQANVYDGMQSSGRKVDLRKVLPGGALDPRRGIPGAGGIDGLTGPHTDLFAKISNRYKIVETSVPA